MAQSGVMFWTRVPDGQTRNGQYGQKRTDAMSDTKVQAIVDVNTDTVAKERYASLHNAVDKVNTLAAELKEARKAMEVAGNAVLAVPSRTLTGGTETHYWARMAIDGFKRTTLLAEFQNAKMS